MATECHGPDDYLDNDDAEFDQQDDIDWSDQEDLSKVNDEDSSASIGQNIQCWKCDQCDTVNNVLVTIADQDGKCVRCKNVEYKPDITKIIFKTKWITTRDLGWECSDCFAMNKDFFAIQCINCHKNKFEPESKEESQHVSDDQIELPTLGNMESNPAPPESIQSKCNDNNEDDGNNSNDSNVHNKNVEQSGPISITPTCYKQHPLEPGKTESSSVVCNICNRYLKVNSFIFRCPQTKECNIDLCVTCYADHYKFKSGDLVKQYKELQEKNNVKWFLRSIDYSKPRYIPAEDDDDDDYDDDQNANNNINNNLEKHKNNRFVHDTFVEKIVRIQHLWTNSLLRLDLLSLTNYYGVQTEYDGRNDEMETIAGELISFHEWPIISSGDYILAFHKDNDQYYSGIVSVVYSEQQIDDSNLGVAIDILWEDQCVYIEDGDKLTLDVKIKLEKDGKPYPLRRCRLIPSKLSINNNWDNAQNNLDVDQLIHVDTEDDDELVQMDDIMNLINEGDEKEIEDHNNTSQQCNTSQMIIHESNWTVDTICTCQKSECGKCYMQQTNQAHQNNHNGNNNSKNIFSTPNNDKYTQIISQNITSDSETPENQFDTKITCKDTPKLFKNDILIKPETVRSKFEKVKNCESNTNILHKIEEQHQLDDSQQTTLLLQNCSQFLSLASQQTIKSINLSSRTRNVRNTINIQSSIYSVIRECQTNQIILLLIIKFIKTQFLTKLGSKSDEISQFDDNTTDQIVKQIQEVLKVYLYYIDLSLSLSLSLSLPFSLSVSSLFFVGLHFGSLLALRFFDLFIYLLF